MGYSRLVLVAWIAFTACAVPARERGGPDEPADAGSLPSETDAGGLADATPSADATVADAAAAVADAAPCAAPTVETWSGTGSRDNVDGYPDHITATITWTRTGTVGCVDTYAPSGSAHYGYAIPGALCDQSIDPDTHDVAAADGTLTIDRTTSPPTYAGSGATYWTFVFRCEYSDGTFDESEMPGGAPWFDASGTVEAGAIGGSYQVDNDDDTDACGPNGIAPCVYSWQFTAH